MATMTKDELDWYAMMRKYINQKTVTQPKKPVDPIEAATDDKLILELIARGYAVWKPPVGE